MLDDAVVERLLLFFFLFLSSASLPPFRLGPNPMYHQNVFASGFLHF